MGRCVTAGTEAGTTHERPPEHMRLPHRDRPSLPGPLRPHEPFRPQEPSRRPAAGGFGRTRLAASLICCCTGHLSGGLPAQAQAQPAEATRGPPPGPGEGEPRRADLDLRQDFGARGDGKSDDTGPLQAFLDACVTTGRRCTAPGGTYTHTGLTLDTARRTGGVVIEGAGAGATVWKSRPGSKGHALTILGSGGYGNQSRPRIADLTIDGSGIGLDGIHFSDLGGDARSLGGYTQGADLRDMTIRFAGRDGVYVGRNVNAGQTFNLWVAHPGRNGVTIAGGGDWRFLNSQFYGAQRAGLPITAMADGGSGAARVTTARPHGLASGTTVDAWGMNGGVGARGTWRVSVVDATRLDLVGSTYTGDWANNGWIVPVLPIANAERSPEGAVRLTTTQPHGQRTGDQVFVRDVLGTPANGHWIVTVVDERTVDLQASTFFKPYGSGGTLRPASFGVAIASTASNFFSDCTIYSSMLGLSVTSNSGNMFRFSGGEINGNWIGGLSIASLGYYAPNAVTNAQLASNSAIKAGAYSDILLMNTGATAILGNQFVLQGGPSKYLVEAIAPTDSITYAGNAFATHDGARPFALGQVNGAKIKPADGRGE